MRQMFWLLLIKTSPYTFLIFCLFASVPPTTYPSRQHRLATTEKRLAVYQQRMNPRGSHPSVGPDATARLHFWGEDQKGRNNNSNDDAYQSHAVWGRNLVKLNLVSDFLMPLLILVGCLFVGSLGLKVTTSPTNTTEMRSCCHRYGNLFLHSSHENEWQNAVRGVFKCCTEPAAGVLVHSNCVCFHFHLNNRCLTRL